MYTKDLLWAAYPTWTPTICKTLAVSLFLAALGNLFPQFAGRASTSRGVQAFPRGSKDLN